MGVTMSHNSRKWATENRSIFFYRVIELSINTSRFEVQSNLDISNSDISNSAKLEASI